MAMEEWEEVKETGSPDDADAKREKEEPTGQGCCCRGCIDTVCSVFVTVTWIAEADAKEEEDGEVVANMMACPTACGDNTPWPLTLTTHGSEEV